MQIAISISTILTFYITYVVSKVFWSHRRRARATGSILHDEVYLRKIISYALLCDPPPHLSRYATRPNQAGFRSHFDLFIAANLKTIFGMRKIWRTILVIVLVISGIMGWLVFGWLGLSAPIINFIIIGLAMNSSMTGEIGEIQIESAVEDVQIIALIIHRWLPTSRDEIVEWKGVNQHMQLLYKVVSTISN
jgi:hypothetical protein